MQIRTYLATQQELRNAHRGRASLNMQNCMFFLVTSGTPNAPETCMTPESSNFTVSGSSNEPSAEGPPNVVDQAQHVVGQVARQAKRGTTSQLDSQKDRATDSLVIVAQALRQTGQHLHEQEQGAIAGYVDQTAQRVEQLTNHLRARDVSQLVRDTEDLARRNPGVFLGAAVAIGFLGARFLKSSGDRARVGHSPETQTGVAERSRGTVADTAIDALVP
jgi:hypothetical protein